MRYFVNFIIVILAGILSIGLSSTEGEDITMHDRLEVIENSKTWKELWCDGYSIYIYTLPYAKDSKKIFEVEDRQSMRIGNRWLSPDYKRVAFTIETYKNYYTVRINKELFLINNDGTNLRKLELGSLGNIFLITFLGNNKLLLRSYEKEKHLIKTETQIVWLFDLNTNNIRKIDDSRINQGSITQATASLKGDLLIYPAKEGHPKRGGFVVYDIENKTVRKINIEGDRPILSPDGEKILFRRGGMTGSYYMINIDGSNESLILSEKKIRSLLRDSGDYRDLHFTSWSPDSRLILLLESSDLQKGKTFVLDVETKEIGK